MQMEWGHTMTYTTEGVGSEHAEDGSIWMNYIGSAHG
jgi:hypothetical protein